MNRKTVNMVFRFLLITMVLLLVFAGQVLAETPGTPTLVSPVHGEIVHGTSVELEWTPAAGATHYAVWIYNLTTEEQVFFEVVGEGTSYIHHDFLDNGDYYAWSVVASNIDDATWGDFAIPIAFIDGSDDDLLPPTLISPEHYANVAGTSVELQWEAPVGGTHYAVWVYNLTKDEEVIFSAPMEETSYTLAGFADDGDIYAWSAVASDIDLGIWSDFAFPRLFTNGTPPTIDYLTVTSTDPADGATDVSVDSNIVVTFDRNIQLVDPSAIYIPNASLNISVEDNKLIFDPDEGMDYQLDYDFTYLVQIGVDTVAWADDADVKLENPYEFSFTTEEAQPYPHFKVDPDNSNIWGHEWPAEIGISVTIGDPLDPEWSGDTQTNEWGDFDFSNIEFEILPGHLVTVSDGVTTKEHTVTALRNVIADPGSNTVSGEAAAGSEVDVLIHDGPHQVVTAAGDGTWEWVVDPGDFDITAGTSGIAWQSDDDIDETHIHWWVPSPFFMVEPNNNEVWGHEWPPETPITVEIWREGTLESSDTIDSNEWGDFELWDIDIDIQVGDLVTVYDGVTEIEHVVKYIEVTEIDEDNNLVHGKAEPNSWVEAEVHVDHGDRNPRRLVQADSEGNWSANFNVPGDGDCPCFEETYDIGPGSRGAADRWEDDRSAATRIHWRIELPHFKVDPDNSNIWGHEWPEYTGISVTIEEEDGAVWVEVWSDNTTTNEWGDFDFSNIEFEILPGHRITVTDEDTTKVHIVTELRNVVADPDTNTISGEAAAGSEVDVFIHDGPHQVVTAAGDGSWEWVVDPAIFDITAGTSGIAWQIDDEWDETHIHWHVPNPRLGVNPVTNVIYGFDWACGAEITITVNGVDYITQAGEGDEDWITCRDFRFKDEALDIEAGNEITVTDGETTRVYTVTSLQITEVDYKNDKIIGTAEANSDVNVAVWGDPRKERHETADGDGNWVADFSVAVGDEPWQDAHNIEAFNAGSAYQLDDAGNYTVIHWQVPVIRATVDGNNTIIGYGWTCGTEITIIDGSGTVFTTYAGLGLEGELLADCGEFWFEDPELVISAGDKITVTDGIVTKELDIVNLVLTDINATDDTVSGTADDDIEIVVFVGSGDEWFMRNVTAEGGSWFADFSVSVGDEPWEQAHDITTGDEVWIQHRDEYGDATTIIAEVE